MRSRPDHPPGNTHQPPTQNTHTTHPKNTHHSQKRHTHTPPSPEVWGLRGSKPKKSRGPKGWGARKVGGQKFRAFFFLSPAGNFILFFSLLAPRRSNVLWALSGCGVETRRPRGRRGFTRTRLPRTRNVPKSDWPKSVSTKLILAKSSLACCVWCGVVLLFHGFMEWGFHVWVLVQGLVWTVPSRDRPKFRSFLQGCRGFTRQPENSKRAHLTAPAPPMRRPPREGRTNENGGGRKKSAKFWAPHPSGPQP